MGVPSLLIGWSRENILWDRQPGTRSSADFDDDKGFPFACIGFINRRLNRLLRIATILEVPLGLLSDQGCIK